MPLTPTGFVVVPNTNYDRYFNANPKFAIALPQI